MTREPIYVTRPTMPPLEEFIPYLEEIWNSRILTNAGPLHQRLEEELERHLGVKHLVLFNNGTNALMTAVQALGLKGEVITTPFSFIATANSLVWNGVKPVFIDIDPDTLNLDPALIEAAITPETTGIMPVHCFGRPCDTAAIQRIAKKHGLKVIYDAAHAFGVTVDGQSILNEGDLSVLSFHATKVFNTFEGGAIVCHDAAMKKRIVALRNFGLEDEITVNVAGINGKMSEVHAAMGLSQLKIVDSAIRRRLDLARLYRVGLAGLPGITPLDDSNPGANGAYFPILIEGDSRRDGVLETLASKSVFARRYFYPLISNFNAHWRYRAGALPIAERIAAKVLCLPLYPELDNDAQSQVIQGIQDYWEAAESQAS